MSPTIFDAIEVDERVNLCFPFADEMEAGETIVSVAITWVLKSGADATPSACLVGAALVSNERFEVTQRVQGRVAPTVYKVRCTATLSSGRALARIAELPVISFI